MAFDPSLLAALTSGMGGPPALDGGASTSPIQATPPAAPQAVPQAPQPQPQSPQSPSDFTPSSTQLSHSQRIFDKVLAMHGQQPYYLTRAREQDMAQAMQGFTQDPMGAIQKVAQIPGMAQEADRMYQEYQQNQRANPTSALTQAQKRTGMMQTVAGFLGAADEKNYPQALARANQFLKLNGEDPSNYNLPQAYDKDAVSQFTSGSETPEQQSQLAIGAAYKGALGQAATTRAQTGQENATNRDRYWQGVLADREKAMQIKQNQAQQAQRMKFGYTTQVQTRFGALPMNVAPGGKRAQVVYKAPDGGSQTFNYERNGDDQHWQLIGRADDGGDNNQ